MFHVKQNNPLQPYLKQAANCGVLCGSGVSSTRFDAAGLAELATSHIHESPRLIQTRLDEAEAAQHKLDEELDEREVAFNSVLQQHSSVMDTMLIAVRWAPAFTALVAPLIRVRLLFITRKADRLRERKQELESIAGEYRKRLEAEFESFSNRASTLRQVITIKRS